MTCCCERCKGLRNGMTLTIQRVVSCKGILGFIPTSPTEHQQDDPFCSDCGWLRNPFHITVQKPWFPIRFPGKNQPIRCQLWFQSDGWFFIRSLGHSLASFTLKEIQRAHGLTASSHRTRHVPLHSKKPDPKQNKRKPSDSQWIFHGRKKGSASFFGWLTLKEPEPFPKEVERRAHYFQGEPFPQKSGTKEATHWRNRSTVMISWGPRARGWHRKRPASPAAAGCWPLLPPRLRGRFSFQANAGNPPSPRAQEPKLGTWSFHP